LADDRETLTRQVKEANDIVDVVGAYVALRQVGQSFKGLCPFHDDRNPSFTVSPKFQNYRCWSCGKFGDVFNFIQEIDRVSFLEARELLARRAGITLEKKGANQQNAGRALMLECVRWAQEQYRHCLLDSPTAEAARRYVGERGLSGETVRRFGLGFAPPAGDWLLQRAARDHVSVEMLEKVGLIARAPESNEYYARFRDRVIFPIRDVQSRPVGFGGRILPTSPYADRAPKYYNSCDTPLFTKSEQLYGLDEARRAAADVGYLAVVEGYTDVLMAHQFGIANVVATMGTALNDRHVKNLRRFVPRVVLVFDADKGGETGVDRALEIFVGQEMELAIATLPEGLDPCDLLLARGVEPFQQALVGAVDALDYKLNRVLARESSAGVEGKRRSLEAVLAVIALAPEMSGQNGQVKLQLIVTRIAQRLGVREETVWARLNELRDARRDRRESRRPEAETEEPQKRQAPAAPAERQLLQALLAEPALVAEAAAEVAPEQLQHPGLRRLYEGLRRLQADGVVPDLDNLRPLLDTTELAAWALKAQEVGRMMPDRSAALRQILDFFKKSQIASHKQELQDQLHAAVGDHDQALELLRRLQRADVKAS
jgi:DNA primase